MKTRKEELYTQLAVLEVLMSIYSASDIVRYSQLKDDARVLELELLDILTEENEVFLESINLNKTISGV